MTSLCLRCAVEIDEGEMLCLECWGAPKPQPSEGIILKPGESIELPLKEGPDGSFTWEAGDPAPKPTYDPMNDATLLAEGRRQTKEIRELAKRAKQAYDDESRFLSPLDTTKRDRATVVLLILSLAAIFAGMLL